MKRGAVLVAGLGTALRSSGETLGRPRVCRRVPRNPKGAACVNGLGLKVAACTRW